MYTLTEVSRKGGNTFRAQTCRGSTTLEQYNDLTLYRPSCLSRALEMLRVHDSACTNFGGPGSFHIASKATNNMPVTSVLSGSPNIFPPAVYSPTAVPAALTVTIV